MTDFETILLDRKGRVGIVTLNRPKALNALNSQLMREVVAAVEELDADGEIGAILLTGSEKAFAAGADIKEMAPKTFAEVYAEDLFSQWDRLSSVRKPIVAAVSGYALGGGCELAMLCDFIIASDTAKFGQPEIKLGVIPGIGGSQRLTRAVGKAKAMDMCLTGRNMDAEEAERAGLVSRIVPAAELFDVALETATAIASMSLPVAIMAKEAVNRSFETTLAEGVKFERRVFHSTFATADQKEGMAAFVVCRPSLVPHHLEGAPPVSKSPASCRIVAMMRSSVSMCSSGIPGRAKTSVLSFSVAWIANARPSSVSSMRVARRSLGCGVRRTSPAFSSRSTALVTLVGCTCRRALAFAIGNAPDLVKCSSVRSS